MKIQEEMPVTKEADASKLENESHTRWRVVSKMVSGQEILQICGG